MRGAAVYTQGVANTDAIDNNYFEGANGIYLDAISTTVNVNHNLFATTVGISAFSPAHSFSVSNNVFMGGAATPISDSSGLGTYSFNYCDPANSNCTTCVSNGQCDTPTVPFAMP